MSDTDLRALERATESSPDDPRAWLARAQGALRVGVSEDAVSSFYRAAALGGDLAAVREGLHASRVPATPWGHPFGDARRSRCSPLAGPRKGEIVARAPILQKERNLVLGEDGTIVTGLPGGLRRLEGRTFSRLSNVPIEGTWEAPMAAAGEGLLVVTTTGDQPSVATVAGDSLRYIDVPGLSSDRSLEAPLVTGRHVLIVREGDRSIGSIHGLSVSLEELRWFDAGGYGAALTADSERIIFFDASGTHYVSLRSLSWEGNPLLTFPFADAPRTEPVLDAQGRILAVTMRGAPASRSMNQLWCVAEGDILWSHNFFGDHEGFVTIATTRDGGLWLVTESHLERLDPGGRPVWADDHWNRSDELVADKDGFVYSAAIDRDDPHLEARSPTGAELFRVSGPFRPAAIDAFGRLLAVSKDEIVAIA
jgi:hypothetical protein